MKKKKSKELTFYDSLINPNYRGNKCKKMHFWKRTNSKKK